MHHFLSSRYIRYGYVAVPNYTTNYVDQRLMLLRRKTLKASVVNICAVNKDGHIDALYTVIV